MEKNAGKIGGYDKSLDDIENYLRSPTPYHRDSRLHACIVCASISCPNLRIEAYNPDDLDIQMTEQMIDFLNNTKKGLLLDKNSKTLTLSKIFFWFESDFQSDARNPNKTVIDFILPYLPNDDLAQFIMNNKQNLKVTYFEYNWDVNGNVECNSTNRLCFRWWPHVILTCVGILFIFTINNLLLLL